MEFFAAAGIPTDEQTLQQRLDIASLPAWCASIDAVLEDQGDHGTIYCLWGQFDVHRLPIRGGVRFSLPHCPNALAWTVTTGLAPDPQQVVVHCTIARTGHDPDFIESIETFVADWRRGLQAGLTD